MKKFFLVFTVSILVTTFLTSCKKDDVLDPYKELPNEALEFVRKYFPNTRCDYMSNNLYNDMYGQLLSVTLTDYTRISFNHSGEWVSIESYSPLHSDIISSVDYLETKLDVINRLFPNSDINGVEKTRLGTKIRTSFFNNLIILNHNGDCLLGQVDEIYNLPNKVYSFLDENTNYIDYGHYTTDFGVEILEENKLRYKVISGHYYFNFDINYSWYEFNYHSTKPEFYNEFPKEIVKHLNAYFPNNVIFEGKIVNDNYVLTLNTGQIIVVNSEGVKYANKIKPYELANDHFRLRGDEHMKIDVISDDICFNHFFMLNNGYLEIIADTDGEWVTIQHFYDFYNQEDSRFALPRSLLNTLPDGICDYLNEKYEGEDITLLRKENDEIFILVDNKINLKFSKDGVFIEIVK